MAVALDFSVAESLSQLEMSFRTWFYCVHSQSFSGSEQSAQEFSLIFYIKISILFP